MRQMEKVTAFRNARIEGGQPDEGISGGLVNCDVLPMLQTERTQEHTVWALPNLEGGVTANVTLYAGINRNTEYPEEAFAFLDMLLSDEMMSGSGFQTEGIKSSVASLFASRQNEFSVNENVMEKKLAQINPSDAQQISVIGEKINAVRFYSDLDRGICNMMMHSSFNAEDQKAAVHKVYEELGMKLAE